MATERVTVTFPAEVRIAAQRLAEAEGLPLSAVVSQAVQAMLRSRLVDEWLAEHQREQGEFDELELQALAAEVGLPYLPPASRLTAV